MRTIHLVGLDWFFIVLYCLIAFGIGVYFSRRAGKSIDEFFIAGRELPWWLAGTSMVATTFAADTPLAVSGFVRSDGIYYNWFWWNALMGGMLCVFFYARLWRRAGIVTDIEFIELRYEGRPASALRGFMALYGGVLSNCITMGWVMLAMAKTLDVMLGWDKLESLTILIAITLIYTVLSGYWGVVMTDLIQFTMAMTGSLALAGIVLWNMGGFGGLIEKVASAPGVSPKVFHLVPDFATATKLAVITFVIQIAFMWWGGGQGGGYLAQRLFSTRDERHSALAALWFNFAHYVLRPWPWILVGLASLYFIPQVEGYDPERAYPEMIARFLPAGLRGLMVASLLAAFMSTMDTHLNWGASYLINDLYRRFLVRNASERHYVNASRVAICVLMGLGAFAAWKAETIKGAWIYLATLTAGAGFVGLLRWYWWRVNPWSEIVALGGSFVIANGSTWFALLRRIGAVPETWQPAVDWFYHADTFAIRLLFIIVVCTALWLGVTFATRPVSDAHLAAFYRRVRPGGWWSRIAAACPEVPRDKAAPGWVGWAAGVVCIYAGLFGVGHVCLARPVSGFALLAVAAIAGRVMVSRASVRQAPDA